MKLSVSNKLSKYTRRKKSKHLRKTYKKKVRYVRKTRNKIINFNIKKIIRGGTKYKYDKKTEDFMNFLIEYHIKNTPKLIKSQSYLSREEEEMLKLTPTEEKLLTENRELTTEEKNQALDYYKSLPDDEKLQIYKLQQKNNLLDRTTWLYYYLHAKYPDIIKPDIIKPDSMNPYPDNHSRMHEVDG
jgi:hypothetical protein